MASYATYGLQVVQGFAGFMIGSIQASLAAKLQGYQNQMLKVQEAMNANRITENEINTQDAAVRLSFALQMQSSDDIGAAEVAAAAAGVKGASVDSTLRGFRRSEANRQTGRKSQYDMEMRSHLKERRDNALATALAKNIEINQGPSILSAVTGVALNLLNTYKDGQTPSQKAGPSSVTTPSASLGLGGTTADTLLAKTQDDYWRWNTGPNG